MIQNKIVVGISHGDINGVSYEVIIKSLMDNRIFDFCIPVVYGSAKVAAYHRKALNIVNFSFNNSILYGFNEDEFEFDPTQVDAEEFTLEEYEDLRQGRIIGKDGFLYEIQGDGSIMMIDVCE